MPVYVIILLFWKTTKSYSVQKTTACLVLNPMKIADILTTMRQKVLQTLREKEKIKASKWYSQSEF